MRKIEFRGKRIDNGEWVYGYYLCVEEYNEHFISQRAESGGIAWIEVHPSAIGQFTGPHDRNGKPIYEGDLWARGSFLGVVTFEFSGWNFKKHEESKCYEYPNFYSNAATGEVIGTIHD